MPPAPEIDALIARLEASLAALAAEARAYPGPIARCDDQLPALLERRAKTARALQAARELKALVDALDP